GKATPPPRRAPAAEHGRAPMPPLFAHEEDPRGVEAPRVFVDHHARVGRDAERPEQLRAFVRSRNSEGASYRYARLVDVEVDRAGNVATAVVRDLVRHVDDPKIGRGALRVQR